MTINNSAFSYVNGFVSTAMNQANRNNFVTSVCGHLASRIAIPIAIAVTPLTLLIDLTNAVFRKFAARDAWGDYTPNLNRFVISLTQHVMLVGTFAAISALVAKVTLVATTYLIHIVVPVVMPYAVAAIAAANPATYMIAAPVVVTILLCPFIYQAARAVANVFRGQHFNIVNTFTPPQPQPPEQQQAQPPHQYQPQASQHFFSSIIPTTPTLSPADKRKADITLAYNNILRANATEKFFSLNEKIWSDVDNIKSRLILEMLHLKQTDTLIYLYDELKNEEDEIGIDQVAILTTVYNDNLDIIPFLKNRIRPDFVTGNDKANITPEHEEVFKQISAFFDKYRLSQTINKILNPFLTKIEEDTYPAEDLIVPRLSIEEVFLRDQLLLGIAPVRATDTPESHPVQNA